MLTPVILYLLVSFVGCLAQDGDWDNRTSTSNSSVSEALVLLAENSTSAAVNTTTTTTSTTTTPATTTTTAKYEELNALNLCDDTTGFNCATGTNSSQADSVCVPKACYCDGVWDCEEGSDELSCYFESCPRSHVLCTDKSACVPPLRICDGKYDCRDHSDEVGCSNQRECESEGKIFCDTKLCISDGLHCDGKLDCEDGKDEQNCTCSQEEFKCENSKCVSLDSRCDGVTDCTDGSDEWSCYRLDENHVALTSNGLDWFPVCHNISSAREDGDRICQSMSFSKATETGSLRITPLNNATNCSEALTISCEQYTCEIKSSPNNITKSAATPQDIKSLLMIKSPDNQACKSQILSPLWLLASHECLSSKFSSLENLTVQLAENVTAELDEVIVHTHSSKFRSVFVRDFDFVLLKARQPLDLEFYNLTAISLPDQKIDLGITCFGVVSQDHEDVPYILRDISVCNVPKHYNGSVSERHLCAESQNGITAIPVGSPLICLTAESKWFLAGLMTYSHNTSYMTHPAVFSNIFSVKPFLQQVMGSRVNSVPHDASIYEVYNGTAASWNTSDFNGTLIVDLNQTSYDNETLIWEDATLGGANNSLTSLNGTDFETTTYTTPAELENSSLPLNFSMPQTAETTLNGRNRINKNLTNENSLPTLNSTENERLANLTRFLFDYKSTKNTANSTLVPMEESQNSTNSPLDTRTTLQEMFTDNSSVVTTDKSTTVRPANVTVNRWATESPKREPSLKITPYLNRTLSNMGIKINMTRTPKNLSENGTDLDQEFMTEQGPVDQEANRTVILFN
ncbi:Low-density lipoprotein receptor-related protein 4 [Halotydeus destructor]|nr:Low-density lipoprotein receptor-related protein 4 [Halotydeus destructor]